MVLQLLQRTTTLIHFKNLWWFSVQFYLSFNIIHRIMTKNSINLLPQYGSLILARKQEKYFDFSFPSGQKRFLLGTTPPNVRMWFTDLYRLCGAKGLNKLKSYEIFLMLCQLWTWFCVKICHASSLALDVSLTAFVWHKRPPGHEDKSSFRIWWSALTVTLLSSN